MSGCERGKHRPSTLRKWLEAQGYIEGLHFWRRRDGWYSLARPTASADVHRPRVRA
jgi:hypothetical protein